MYPLSDQKAGKAYTIFCGVCEYDEESLKFLKQAGDHGFQSWNFHINSGDLSQEQILRIFSDYYYESYINCIFPEFKKKDKSFYNPSFANHTHRLSKKLGITEQISVRDGEKMLEHELAIDYLDVFLFPGDIAIYSFRCDFTGVSYHDISLLVNHIRNHAASGFNFIREHARWLISAGQGEGSTLVFGNKLKSFTLVETGQDISAQEEDDLLYDLATCSPVGSAAGYVSYYKPTVTYLDKLRTENTISVFDNWKGMCLFDSFTGLFRKDVLNTFIWENAYFNLIFLHSVYLKYYLFRTNRKFYLENADSQKLEDEFYEFDQYFNFKQISFNFLPQIIYEKIRTGLDIEDELMQLQISIERANNIEKSRADKKMNTVLSIIAFLTVFSVIWDGSEWINKLLFNSARSYNIISGILTAIVLILISVFIFRKYKKKS